MATPSLVVIESGSPRKARHQLDLPRGSFTELELIEKYRPASPKRCMFVTMAMLRSFDGYSLLLQSAAPVEQPL